MQQKEQLQIQSDWKNNTGSLKGHTTGTSRVHHNGTTPAAVSPGGRHTRTGAREPA